MLKFLASIPSFIGILFLGAITGIIISIGALFIISTGTTNIDNMRKFDFVIYIQHFLLVGLFIAALAVIIGYEWNTRFFTTILLISLVSYSALMFIIKPPLAQFFITGIFFLEIILIIAYLYSNIIWDKSESLYYKISFITSFLILLISGYVFYPILL